MPLQEEVSLPFFSSFTPNYTVRAEQESLRCIIISLVIAFFSLLVLCHLSRLVFLYSSTSPPFASFSSLQLQLKPPQSPTAHQLRKLPMLLSDHHLVNIHTILKPPLLIRNFHIIPTHLSLPHSSIRCKRPILETVRTPPLPGGIVPLVPKLDCDLEFRVSVVYLTFHHEIFCFLAASVQNSSVKQLDAKEENPQAR